MPPQTDLPDLEQDTAIIRAHQRLHANAAEWDRAGGASRALTAAKLSTNWRDSSLQRPLVSRATTSRRHLSARKSSDYFRSLSRALVQTAPSALAAPGCAVPSDAMAHRRVMSTASRAPKNKGRPVASTSMVLSSFAPIRNSVFERLPHNTSEAPQMGLLSSARLVQHYVLPEVVFGR